MSTTRKTTPDYYKILHIEHDETTENIKKKYKKLSKKHHPDKHAQQGSVSVAEAEEKMAMLNEAIAVLGDPEKRKAYDELLQETNQDSDPLIRLAKRQQQNINESNDEIRQKSGSTLFALMSLPIPQINLGNISSIAIADSTLDHSISTTPKAEKSLALPSPHEDTYQTRMLSPLITILLENNLATDENLDKVRSIDLKATPHSPEFIKKIIALIKIADTQMINQSIFDKILSFCKAKTVRQKIHYPSTVTSSSSALAIFNKDLDKSYEIVEINLLAQLHFIVEFMVKNKILNTESFNQLVELQQWVIHIVTIFTILSRYNLAPEFYKQLIFIKEPEKIEAVQHLLECIFKKINQSRAAKSAFKDNYFGHTDRQVVALFFSRLLTNILKDDISSLLVTRVSLAIDEFVETGESNNYLVSSGWNYMLLLSERPEESITIAGGIIASRNGEFNYIHHLVKPACKLYLDKDYEKTNELNFILRIYLEFGKKYHTGSQLNSLDMIYHALCRKYKKISMESAPTESTALTILPERSLILTEKEALPLAIRNENTKIPKWFNPNRESPYFNLYDTVGNSRGTHFYASSISEDHEKITQDYIDLQTSADSDLFSLGTPKTLKAAAAAPTTTILPQEIIAPKETKYITYANIKQLTTAYQSKKTPFTPDDDIYTELRIINIHPSTKPEEACEIILASKRLLYRYNLKIITEDEFKTNPQPMMKKIASALHDQNNSIINMCNSFAKQCQESAKKIGLSPFDQDALLNLQYDFERETKRASERNKRIELLLTPIINEHEFLTFIKQTKTAKYKSSNPILSLQLNKEEEAVFQERVAPQLDIEYLSCIDSLINKMCAEMKDDRDNQPIAQLEAISAKINTKLSELRTSQTSHLMVSTFIGSQHKKRPRDEESAATEGHSVKVVRTTQ